MRVSLEATSMLTFIQLMSTDRLGSTKLDFHALSAASLSSDGRRLVHSLTNVLQCVVVGEKPGRPAQS